MTTVHVAGNQASLASRCALGSTQEVQPHRPSKQTGKHSEKWLMKDSSHPTERVPPTGRHAGNEPDPKSTLDVTALCKVFTQYAFLCGDVFNTCNALGIHSHGWMC